MSVALFRDVCSHPCLLNPAVRSSQLRGSRIRSDSGHVLERVFNEHVKRTRTIASWAIFDNFVSFYGPGLPTGRLQTIAVVLVMGEV